MYGHFRTTVRAGFVGLLTLTAPGPVLDETPHNTTESTLAETQAAAVTPLLTKALKDISGKEVLMLTVEYQPGGTDPVHRHNAHAFIYVLEGSIVMQVQGGPQVTLNPGQTFYEGPDDIHAVGRNASSTKPARFVVFFVKGAGSPPVVPVP